MNKVLFLYNDINDVIGVSSVMMVVERYAMNKSKEGEFVVKGGEHPRIQFDNGSSIDVLPVTRGLTGISKYDEIYIDETMDISDISENPRDNIMSYNSESFM